MAGLYAIPMALAFGALSGLGPTAGLYGTIAVGLIACLLGGTPSLISGPTGLMTIASAVIISDNIQQFSGLNELAYTTILATFLLAGLFQVIFCLVRLGDGVKYIPYPVVSGLRTGVGVTIILLQIFPMLGYMPPHNMQEAITQINMPIAMVNYAALSLTLVTLAIIYSLPRITEKFPGPLVALVAVSIATNHWALDVPHIGDVSTSLPQFKLDVLMDFQFVDFKMILLSALSLAALASIDTLLTANVADNMTRTTHDSNRELLGQGAGNIISALIGGLPGAGATLRTVMNITAGGRGRLSGFTHALLVLMMVLMTAQYAEHIPYAVLAGVLITVGFGVTDFKGLSHLLHVPRSEAFITLAVFLITLTVGLLHAVAVGMVLAAFLFMKKMGQVIERQTQVVTLTEVDEELPWKDELTLADSIAQHVYIKHLYGPLFFGFTSKFQDLFKRIPSEASVVIIRMEKVTFIDQTGLYALEEAIEDLLRKNIRVLITGAQGEPLKMLTETRLIPDIVPEEKVFAEFEACKNWLKQHVS